MLLKGVGGGVEVLAGEGSGAVGCLAPLGSGPAELS